MNGSFRVLPDSPVFIQAEFLEFTTGDDNHHLIRSRAIVRIAELVSFPVKSSAGTRLILDHDFLGANSLDVRESYEQVKAMLRPPVVYRMGHEGPLLEEKE